MCRAGGSLLGRPPPPIHGCMSASVQERAEPETVQYTATELHDRPGRVLHDVRLGKRVEVTDARYGDVLAVILRPELVTP
jgi:hypothetical protein